MTVPSDHGAIGRHGIRDAVEIGARQVSQSDHAACLRPHERFGSAAAVAVADSHRTIGRHRVGDAVEVNPAGQVSQTHHAACLRPANRLGSVAAVAVADDHRSVCGNGLSQAVEVNAAGQISQSLKRGPGLGLDGETRDRPTAHKDNDE